MINKPTCFKNPDKPTCIDLILISCPGSFQNPCVIDANLSGFHKMIVTVLKTPYLKIEPTFINYRNYRSFSNEGFRKLSHQNLQGKLSGKYVRGNQVPIFNKTPSKAVALKTKLRNKFFKINTD